MWVTFYPFQTPSETRGLEILPPHEVGGEQFI